MNRSEDVDHFRSYLRQCGCDETKKLMFVADIMDIAIDILEPVKAKITRPMSVLVRQLYLDKGISLEWSLPLYRDAFEPPLKVDIATHISQVRQAFSAWQLEWKQANCYGEIGEFCSLAKDADISPDQKKAAKLLGVCIQAMNADILTDHVRDWILSAYAGLDFHTTEVGRKFIKGRKPNTGGRIRKAIAKVLKKNPDLKNPELWAVLAAKPPNGWEFCDNRQGKYIEGPNIKQDHMVYRRFCTVCGEERKKLKP